MRNINQFIMNSDQKTMENGEQKRIGATAQSGAKTGREEARWCRKGMKIVDALRMLGGEGEKSQYNIETHEKCMS